MTHEFDYSALWAFFTLKIFFFTFFYIFKRLHFECKYLHNPIHYLLACKAWNINFLIFSGNVCQPLCHSFILLLQMRKLRPSVLFSFQPEGQGFELRRFPSKIVGASLFYGTAGERREDLTVQWREVMRSHALHRNAQNHWARTVREKPELCHR